MKIIWEKIRRGAGRFAGVGRRALAGAMALVMTLGMVNFTVPQAEGADDYAGEQAARQEEYKNKFNLDTLMWNTKGKAPNGNEVNYGNTARNYLYWQNGSFGGVNYKNYIHVYAFEGDTICFGSDVFNSSLNADGSAVASDAQKTQIEERLGAGATVDIVLRDLRGNRILYDVKENGAGHIPDIQTEVLAKTMERPSGNSKNGVTVTTYTSTGVKTEKKISPIPR